MARNRAARRDYYERTRCGDCGIELAVEAIGGPRMWCVACGIKRHNGKATG